MKVLAVILLALSGCSVLHFQNFSRTKADDWPMYGGTMGRENVSREVLSPPLTVAWESDASAGFGPYSASAADSFLFVGNLKGEVQAMRIRDGKDMGGKDFGSAVVGTPVIDNEMMYVVLGHDEESILAYNLQDAAIRWRANLGDIETSPLFIGRRLYVTTLSGTLFCIDKSDGSTVWSFAIPEDARTRIIRSSPASDGRSIFFGCDNGKIYAVDISNGILRWSFAARATVLASPSVSHGLVYAGSLDSTMYALDAETGILRWARPLGARIIASQAVDQENVYVGTAGHSIFALDAESGDIAWRIQTEGVVNAAPLVSGNVVYVGCIDKKLYALDTKRGDILWQYTAQGRIKSVPIVFRNNLILLAEDFSVIALKHADR